MSNDKKKDKTAGAGLFAQIKQDMSKEMIQAQIEQIYTKGKLTGKFGHAKEIEEQIEIMRQNREEIPVLREKISAKLKREKEVADAETQISKDFKAMADHPDQHPKLKAILEQIADLNINIAGHRFNMHAQISIINDEWKKWEAAALKDIRIKQDQLNHTWCEIKYWRKKDQAKCTECEARYRVITQDFVNLIHDIRKKKEEDIPTWLLCVTQYELEFYMNTIGKVTQIENNVRSMGPVQARDLPGIEKFQLQIDSSYSVPQLMPAPSSAPQQAPVTSFAVAPEPQFAPRAPSPAPTPTAPPGSYKLRAMYDFDSNEKTDLPFKTGEEITIISDAGSGWLNGMNNRGRTGLVPANYFG